MKGCMFNIDSGYLEGLCRGFKTGILTQNDYLNLVQCETLEGCLATSNGNAFNLFFIKMNFGFCRSEAASCRDRLWKLFVERA